MKKVYLKPETSTFAMVVENDMAKLSYSDTGNINPNDPNSGNDGPDIDPTPGDGGDAAKGWGDLWDDELF